MWYQWAPCPYYGLYEFSFLASSHSLFSKYSSIYWIWIPASPLLEECGHVTYFPEFKFSHLSHVGMLILISWGHRKNKIHKCLQGVWHSVCLESAADSSTSSPRFIKFSKLTFSKSYFVVRQWIYLSKFIFYKIVKFEMWIDFLWW